MSSQTGAEKFQPLVKLALDNGAADAKIIPQTTLEFRLAFHLRRIPNRLHYYLWIKRFSQGKAQII